MKLKSSNILAYVHINHTGGTTFKTLLGRLYFENDIKKKIPLPDGYYKGGIAFKFSNKFPILSREYSSIPDYLKSNIEVVEGSVNDSFLKGMNCKYITFVRHPIDRVISHYYWTIRKGKSGNSKIGQYVLNNKISLLDYLKEGKYFDVDNYMVRTLLNDQDGKNVAFGKITDNHLQQAVEIMDHRFEIVGITERYNESLTCMKIKLEWGRIPFYFKQNIGSGKRGIDNTTMIELNKLNKYDLMLYKHASEKLNQLIARQGFRFTRELNKLNMLLPVYRFVSRLNRIIRNPMLLVGKIQSIMHKSSLNILN